MTWSYVLVPLGVIGLSSLVGLGVTIWTSWRWALLLVLLAAISTFVLVYMAVTADELEGLGRGVLAFFVSMPAGFGVAIGAMIATRKNKNTTGPGGQA